MIRPSHLIIAAALLPLVELPAAAADYLDGIIGQARGGRWQAAAERLYTFMMAQRREGAAHSPGKKKHLFRLPCPSVCTFVA